MRVKFPVFLGMHVSTPSFTCHSVRPVQVHLCRWGVRVCRAVKETFAVRTGGIETCFRGNHPEYIETTEKMM